jgi:hypothetical protein
VPHPKDIALPFLSFFPPWILPPWCSAPLCDLPLHTTAELRTLSCKQGPRERSQVWWTGRQQPSASSQWATCPPPSLPLTVCSLRSGVTCVPNLAAASRLGATAAVCKEGSHRSMWKLHRAGLGPRTCLSVCLLTAAVLVS